MVDVGTSSADVLRDKGVEQQYAVVNDTKMKHQITALRSAFNEKNVRYLRTVAGGSEEDDLDASDDDDDRYFSAHNDGVAPPSSDVDEEEMIEAIPVVGEAKQSVRNVTPLRRGTGSAFIGITKENSRKSVVRSSSRLRKVEAVASLIVGNEKISVTCRGPDTVMSNDWVMDVEGDNLNSADSMHPEQVLTTRGSDTVQEAPD